jgi:ABC-type transport system involved in multi-copper enzyme maturation permease subunit
MNQQLRLREISVSGAWVIARREIRDQLRDWRILTPIIILTLFFPLLMNFTAQQAVDFVGRYGAPIIGDRLIPFLLMIVGFFPISISLVIALESFAGERERLSLEPLLATPLSDGELYLGKMLASVTPPLGAAYLGIIVYLVGLFFRLDWRPEPVLLLQILALTTVQAFVMVSGAVVISSQTTSVRAANLLASFIIIPIAELIIGESVIMLSCGGSFSHSCLLQSSSRGWAYDCSIGRNCSVVNSMSLICVKHLIVSEKHSWVERVPWGSGIGS